MTETAPTIAPDDIVEIELLHQRAFDARSIDHLPGVIGFGEIGVVMRWPTESPTIAVKRLAPATDRAGADHQLERIERANAILRQHVRVAPTTAAFTPTRTGGVATYLVQPLYPSEQLVETIIAGAEPTPDHPVLIAIRDAILETTGRRAVLDSQFSNFSFDGTDLTLFDNGSAILVDADGRADTDFGVMLDPVPAPLRPLARRQVGAIAEGLAGLRNNMAHSALSLVRIGQDRWVPSVLEAFNEHLSERLTVDEIHAESTRLHRQLTAVKALARTQRFWTTTVRRRPYDLFITDSFSGRIL